MILADQTSTDSKRWGLALVAVVGAHALLVTLAASIDTSVRVETPEPTMFLELAPLEEPADEPAPPPETPPPPETLKQTRLEPAVPQEAIAPATPPEPQPLVMPQPDPVQVSEAVATVPAEPAQPVVQSPAASPVDDAEPVPIDAKARAREQDYFATLMAWLNRKKTYPSEAKKARQQGVVVVRFSIDREGNVLDASIKKGSGYELLDEATLRLMRMASPMPPMPDSMKKNQLTLSVPVEYSLVTG